MNKNYADRFKGYTFGVGWTGSPPFGPHNNAVDVTLLTRDGQEYSANFVTQDFLRFIFEKNKRTGECANGAYFCMPGMIVVERIDDKAVRDTIDDLIRNSDLEEYFRKMD
jgi:hypothetical protein